MNRHTTTRRYYLILEKIAKDKNSSFDHIKDYLFNMGFEVSKRTIQRDIEAIRMNFGVEIIYNRANDGYAISQEDSIDLNSFLRFLDMGNTAEMLLESLDQGKSMQGIVHFSNDTKLFSGHHLLGQLLGAVKECRVVEFMHYNYEHNTETPYVLEPLLIKEYQNRWYVVGQVGKDTIKTFGLDRIKKLKVTTKSFKTRHKREDLRAEFDGVVGLTYNAIEPISLLIRSTKFHANYLMSLPLHQSQLKESEDRDFVYFRYRLKPNIELVNRILSMGSEVAVIEPESFRSRVHEVLKSMLKLYS